MNPEQVRGPESKENNWASGKSQIVKRWARDSKALGPNHYSAVHYVLRSGPPRCRPPLSSYCYRLFIWSAVVRLLPLVDTILHHCRFINLPIWSWILLFHQVATMTFCCQPNHTDWRLNYEFQMSLPTWPKYWATWPSVIIQSVRS